jgi:hypothetical protein
LGSWKFLLAWEFGSSWRIDRLKLGKTFFEVVEVVEVVVMEFLILVVGWILLDEMDHSLWT